jgi:hypothetical protein
MIFLSSIISLVREGPKPPSRAGVVDSVGDAVRSPTETQGRWLEKADPEPDERLSPEGRSYGFHQGRVVLGGHRARVEEELVVLYAADDRWLLQAQTLG